MLLFSEMNLQTSKQISEGEICSLSDVARATTNNDTMQYLSAIMIDDFTRYLLIFCCLCDVMRAVLFPLVDSSEVLHTSTVLS